MAKRQILTKKEKRSLFTLVFGLAAIFLLMVFIVPEIAVEPIVEGVEATAWQNMHAFFLTVKDWLTSNFYLIVILGAVVAVLTKIRRK